MKISKLYVKVAEIQEVRWDKGSIELADYYTFFCVNENHQLIRGRIFLRIGNQ
jgi:hypothetical protein